MNRRWILTLVAALGLSVPAWAQEQQPNPQIPRDLHGIWFDPGDDGWAAAMFDHDDAMSSVVLTYDDAGVPAWFTAPRLECYRDLPPWVVDYCFGPLYRVTGTWFGASSFRASDVTVKQVGVWDGSFRYPLFGGTGPDQRRVLYLTYSVDGEEKLGNGQKPMRVQQIDPRGNYEWVDARYSGLWGVPSERGWGAGIFVQNDNLYATLFVHGPDRQPRWYVIVAEASPYDDRPDRIFEGEVYETRGFAKGTYRRAGSQSVRKVGTASLHFDAEPFKNATLDYSIDGVEVSKTISR